MINFCLLVDELFFLNDLNAVFLFHVTLFKSSTNLNSVALINTFRLCLILLCNIQRTSLDMDYETILLSVIVHIKFVLL